jgi:hypothetical protein
MDLSLVFVLAIVAYLLGLKLIPRRKRVARFVCMSVLFIVQTILIVALIGSPDHQKCSDLLRASWTPFTATKERMPKFRSWSSVDACHNVFPLC